MIKLQGTEKQIEFANNIMVEVLNSYNNMEILLTKVEMPDELRVLFLNPITESKELVLKVENADRIISSFKDIVYLKTNAMKVKFILNKINCKKFQPANGFLGTVVGNQRTQDLEDNVEQYFG